MHKLLIPALVLGMFLGLANEARKEYLIPPPAKAAAVKAKPAPVKVAKAAKKSKAAAALTGGTGKVVDKDDWLVTMEYAYNANPKAWRKK